MLSGFSKHRPFPRAAKLAFVALFLILAAIAWLPGSAHAQEESEYDLDFDIPELQGDSPFDFWGQLELRNSIRSLVDSSAQYKQRFYNKQQENPALDFQLQALLEFSWKHEQVSAYLRPRTEITWSQISASQSTSTDEPSETFFKKDPDWSGQVLIEEGFVTWEPSPSLTLEVGKKVLKWGKGYAWNPVSFISRPKDVNDPDRSREGYLLAYADSITSLDGPIATLAFTPVVSLLSNEINQTLASGDCAVWGGKMYLLAYDTDFDLVFMTGSRYDTRFGADFATNISENFAIHGESSLRLGYEKTIIDSAGATTQTDINAWSLLLGGRYLTETDTTYILEYFHNGEGYSPSEMRQYFTLISDGYDQYTSTGASTLLKSSSRVSSSYNKSSSGRDYLYFRVSQKEPFDILYLTPALTSIINIGDGSFSLNPEVTYMASDSLQIKPKLVIPIGPSKSEFGEKMNRVNAELSLTYYF